VVLRLWCRVDARAESVSGSPTIRSRPVTRARLEVRLRATIITVYDDAVIIAQHARSLPIFGRSETLMLVIRRLLAAAWPPMRSGAFRLSKPARSAEFTRWCR
jgi:hypothetical protein